MRKFKNYQEIRDYLESKAAVPNSPSFTLELVEYAFDFGQDDGIKVGWDDARRDLSDSPYDRDAEMERHYNEGFDDGFSEGKYEGHDEGYNNGLEEGYSDGYDVGKDEGWQEGYEAGKNEV